MYILALDQGTTGTTALVIDTQGTIRGRGYREIKQYYPQPGWVGHDPNEIWESVLVAGKAALEQAGIGGDDLSAIGITNQRETAILWDGATGKPLDQAVVWQCRRTAAACDALKAAGQVGPIAERTGLVIDAYFSATKMRWLLDHVPEARKNTNAKLGTVDSWLLWNLTGGRVHATEPSNASRTMLFNIHTLSWDPYLLDLFAIPREALPEVRPSAGAFGTTTCFGQKPVPVAGIAGDQQAALFGQACFAPGSVKCTYGTGSFLLMQTGTDAITSDHGLLTTVAWQLPDRVDYAIEGSVFIAGAAIQWLRDELQIIRSAAETEAIAESIPDTGGVYFVPAFVGLGAPYWDQYARGTLVGLTRGSGRPQIVRAALESIAYQVRDVVDAMAADANLPPAELRIDGGASANNFLAQFQADILNAPVIRPRITETTGMGAGLLAGLGTGIWSSTDEIAQIWQADHRFESQMPATTRDRLYRNWTRAVERSRSWAEGEE